LEKSFGPLPKTLFFEYQTIASLSGYFLLQHRERLQEVVSVGTSREPSESKALVRESSQELVRGRRGSSRRRFAELSQEAVKAASGSEGIAVIGLSGRYPGAEDVSAYWSNLRDRKSV